MNSSASVKHIGVESAYPTVADHYVLHLTPNEGYLRDVSVVPSVQRGDTSMLNDIAAEVVSRCDGRTRLNDILDSVSETYIGVGFDMHEACRHYLAELIGEGLVELHTEPVDGTARICGSRDHESPSHFMIELTDKCNLRCAHCYRGSSPELGQHIPKEQLLDIIDQMAALGVSTIELTGGEPTMRPDFLDIFHHCATRFASVAIVSNGWFITDEWARQMARYDHVIVQIDLDGSSAEPHDTLRGRSGSFERSVRAGRAMAKHGVKFRMAMNVYRGNFDCIIETAALARDIGANWFSFSPVTDVGRGRNADILTFEQMGQLMRIAGELEAIHGQEFLRLVDEGLMERAAEEGNCGAGWRSLVLGPNGDVRPCVMVQPSAMALGNLLNQDYLTFLESFDGKYFRDLAAPGPETCTGCSNQGYCQGCFARTLNANDQMVQERGQLYCQWRKQKGFDAYVTDGLQT